jgi:diguanylate cyclase (GGDEF)-like protein
VSSSEQIVGVACLSGAPELPETLRGIAAAALTALGADRATCYAYDVDGQVIAAVYTTEVDPERRAFLEQTVGLGPAQMPIWRLQLAQADPLMAIEDIGRAPTVPPELAARLGSGAILGVRLEHSSVQHAGAPALLGTLFCSFATPRRFSVAERQAARGLAGVAALALANAHLQAETAESLGEARGLAAEQAALRRVATRVAAESRPEVVFAQAAEEVAGLLGVEFGLVARFESGRAVPVGLCGSALNVPLRLSGGGALAEVARSGRVARVDDYGALGDDPLAQLVHSGGFRSGVAAPVRVGGHLWGALLAATTEDVPVGPDAEARLEHFAELVVLAIANAEAQARLVALAANDPLTGLANHRTFFERLDIEVRRARRHGDPLSLIIIDLDHFKRVNDVHGHLAGDGVLVETAGRLTALARAEDTVARIGGEEFAWLLPECDAREAWLAGERARRAIAQTPFPQVGRLTMSAGVAQLGQGMSVTELFRHADAALYWAKGHGRDACVHHAPEQENTLNGHPVADSARLVSGVERLLALTQEQLGLTATMLTEFHGDKLIVRHVAGDIGSFGMRPGMELPVDQTYCARMVERGLPHVIRDTQREKLVRDLPMTRKAGIGAYVGEPVTLPNGEVYGTLCCLSRRAEPGLGAGDVRLLRIVAGILAEELERSGSAERIRGVQGEGVRRVLDGDGLTIVFQPIVELAGGRVVAVEALSRFATEPLRPPDVWFAEAAALGLGLELELFAIRGALAHLDELPAGARLSLNASPETLCTPDLFEALAAFPGERLAVELTEHAPVADYPALRAALAKLRARGVQLMIDDAGAGFSSFKHVIDLGPDVIKLDLSLTRDIDSDPLRRALAASLLAFADEIGATLVAEGIETQAELLTLRALGVTYGQGYLLGSPAPGPVPARVGLGDAVPVVTWEGDDDLATHPVFGGPRARENGAWPVDRPAPTPETSARAAATAPVEGAATPSTPERATPS